MRVFWGLVLGFLLFFPGTVLLKWVNDALGFYREMTLAESCLVMLLILLAVIMVQHWPSRQSRVRTEDRGETRRAAGSRPRSYPREDTSLRRRR